MDRLPLRAVLYTVSGAEAFTVLAPLLLVLTPDISVARPALAAAGMAVIGCGLLLYLWTVHVFLHHGRGTPAAMDAPRELVTAGPFQTSRNPLYLAAIIMLLGETLLFGSSSFLLYTATIAAAYHVFITRIEEPRLAARFDQAYHDYRSAVPRWLPRP